VDQAVVGSTPIRHPFDALLVRASFFYIPAVARRSAAGLAETGVRRVIRENTFNVVPLPGVVWAAVRRELGDPWDVRMAMEEWAERRWARMVMETRAEERIRLRRNAGGGKVKTIRLLSLSNHYPYH
jgi:hypothetical protein